MISKRSALTSLFVGGLLPVVAFALVENFYGTMGGLIAGITFGVGELVYEYFRFRKVQGITIASNILVIALGGLSLIEDNPIFFKLQPALIIFAFAGLLIGSSLLKRPFLVALSRKQNPAAPEVVFQRLGGVNLRLGFCMIGIGLLSVYAAYAWSTANWALLKGVGVPILLVIYLGVEIFLIRMFVKKSKN